MHNERWMNCSPFPTILMQFFSVKDFSYKGICETMNGVIGKVGGYKYGLCSN